MRVVTRGRYICTLHISNIVKCWQRNMQTNRFAGRAPIPKTCAENPARVQDWPNRTNFVRSFIGGKNLQPINRSTGLIRSIYDIAEDERNIEPKDAFQNMEDALFDFLCDGKDKISISKFKTALWNTGLRENDHRLTESMQNFSTVQIAMSEVEGHQIDLIDRETFRQCISENITLITKAFRNQFIIPDFTDFTQHLDKLFQRAKSNTKGKVASYIPQLSRYSPDLWAMSVCTVDGQRFSLGDVSIPFCLQSVSKPLTYALVLNELDPDIVHQYVGHEPSGFTFNHITLNSQNKPHNPMINPGAIVICSLLKQQLNSAERFDFTSNTFKRLTGNEYLAFNNSVFLSERETADRNFALGYYLRENKCFPAGTNLMEVLDFYFQLCSVEVTCESGAMIAATLANGGVCPTTGDKVFHPQAIRNTLSLMHSCGMYDYSGQFAFTVGLPAKSGVSGAIMVVVPNVMGLFLWSPPLDEYGNSYRGLQFCQDLVNMFNFHHYDSLQYHTQKIDPRIRKVETQAGAVVDLLFSACSGDVTALRRCALSGMDMKQADYDGRTALHVAAAEGQKEALIFLLEKCNLSPFSTDRWGFTPLDDAKRFKKLEVTRILEKHMSQ